MIIIGYRRSLFLLFQNCLKLLFSVLMLVYLSQPLTLSAASNLSLSLGEKQFLRSINSIKLCVGPDSIPLDSIENGIHVGVNAEFMVLFERMIGIPIRLIPTDTWKESISNAKSGDCDIISLIQQTPGRKEYLYFTESYVEIPFVVVTTQEKFFAANLEHLIDNQLAIREGYAYAELLRKRYPDIQLKELGSIEQGLEAVNSGKIFGYLTGLQIAGSAIQDGGYSNLKISGQFDELTTIKLGIGVNKTNPFLVSIFNKAIASLTESQTKRINNSWLTVKYEIVEDYQKLYQLAAGAIVIMLFLLYRQRNLRIHNRQLESREREIWQQAKFDFLTGLPNRRYFQEKLETHITQSIDRNISFGLLLIDLDGFKEVNDTLGHDQGDMLLKEASKRIRGCIKEQHTLARLGGDEFVVILAGLSMQSECEHIAQSILHCLKEPFQLKQQAFVSASIGMTAFPKDASTMVELMKNVDQAMYAAKGKGRNMHHHFSPQMRDDALARMTMINDLRQAIKKEEFTVYYQPIVDLQSMQVTKCEALIRWLHPTRGFVSPIEFVSILEDTRMIIEAGEFVFKQSAKQAKLWRESLHPEFQISVNTSAVQFQGRATAGWSEYLDQQKLSKSSIALEITESMLMEGYDDITSHLSGLRNSGFQISLDDFGTGYSSLAYLKKFDIDFLKIDKAFVNNLHQGSNDMVLCEAIIVMAHKLGLKVIAEGVETKEQQILLSEAGCDFGQGYIFSKPVCASDFEKIPLISNISPTLTSVNI
ncbi:MAG: EAL domain-containing protein [Kangiellaceae bacterium]|nr:EAL domain-containing protein [Kangiellaceae bacterium]